MLMTIAMASYGNPDQVWFTVEALRMYQDVSDCEILVLDNQGNDDVKKVVKGCRVRYEVFSDVPGVAPARNKIFELAKGSFVLVLDSHVLLYPKAIQKLKLWLANNWDRASNLIQGPMVLPSLKNAYTHYDDKWRGHAWGTWPPAVNPDSLTEEIEIQMMGMGLFGCRKDSWLGLHPDARGFGGTEGVIHEKYRRAGRKVLCLPFLKWVHKFGRSGDFPLRVEDKIRNYLLGFDEIGMDKTPIYSHFGQDKVAEIERTINRGGSGKEDGKQVEVLP
jgi:glycosyltransferase involved in cell wall biosynthesis